jgi:hypothetical protein
MPEPGLCATCAHCHTVTSARRSKFSLCRRAESDPAYVRYPRLPVLECRGFDPAVSDKKGEQR